MNAYEENGGKTPFILYLNTSWDEWLNSRCCEITLYAFQNGLFILHDVMSFSFNRLKTEIIQHYSLLLYKDAASVSRQHRVLPLEDQSVKTRRFL
jgi:hypothetical protein